MSIFENAVARQSFENGKRQRCIGPRELFRKLQRNLARTNLFRVVQVN